MRWSDASSRRCIRTSVRIPESCSAHNEWSSSNSEVDSSGTSHLCTSLSTTPLHLMPHVDQTHARDVEVGSQSSSKASRLLTIQKVTYSKRLASSDLTPRGNAAPSASYLVSRDVRIANEARNRKADPHGRVDFQRWGSRLAVGESSSNLCSGSCIARHVQQALEHKRKASRPSRLQKSTCPKQVTFSVLPVLDTNLHTVSCLHQTRARDFGAGRNQAGNLEVDFCTRSRPPIMEKPTHPKRVSFPPLPPRNSSAPSHAFTRHGKDMLEQKPDPVMEWSTPPTRVHL